MSEHNNKNLRDLIFFGLVFALAFRHNLFYSNYQQSRNPKYES